MSATTETTTLDAAVAEAVDLFPPLSDDTKDQIAHLLRTEVE